VTQENIALLQLDRQFRERQAMGDIDASRRDEPCEVVQTFAFGFATGKEKGPIRSRS
jgi:hypothetical protein